MLIAFGVFAFLIGIGATVLGALFLSENDSFGVFAAILGVTLAFAGVGSIYEQGTRDGYFRSQVDAANGKVTVRLVEHGNGEKRWETIESK